MGNKNEALEREFKRLKKHRANEIFDETSHSKIFEEEGEEMDGTDANNELGKERLLVS